MAATAVAPAIYASGAEASAPQGAAYPLSSDQRHVAPPKNVVLMICDDLGYGDLGCYGSDLKTPNLDKLAQEGVRFTQYNSAHPICSASRAALLTGRYAQRSHTVGAYFPHAKSGMSLEEVTLANLFHNHGHRTKAIGKWHLGDAPEYLPTSRGFDSYFGVPYSDDMQPLPLIRDTTILEAHTDRDTLTYRYTQEALSFLDNSSKDPFFLYLAYSYPHDPARASASFRGKFGFGDYGDAVQEIDWSVGEITHALEEKGLLQDTLLLFTSDHGPWYQGSAANLRGRKMSTFEGGFRVPLIAHWPSGLRPGHVSHAWASSLDVLPTLVSLCGLAPSPNPLDGIDISALLFGQQSELPRKALLYFTPLSHDGADLHCARKGDWKLRVAQLDGEMYIGDRTSGHTSYWLQHPELYNLASGPGESYDVAKQHPEIVEEILADANAQMQTMPDDVRQSYAELQQNLARITTPPAAAPRPNSNAPLQPWAWEPEDRR
jgi:arylsulfatase